ncbi:MAG: adenosine deaminase [Spirochaetota bacterium]
MLTKPLRILAFLQELPETEIHLHMEAMISIDTILMLLQKNKLCEKLGIHNEDEIYEKFEVKNINDFIQVFYLIQSVFCEEEDFRYLVKDVKRYCKRNNLYYAEIFLAPTKFIKNGLSFEKFINIIDYELKKNDEEIAHNVEIKLLIDVSRNYGTENAMNNLDLVINNKTDSIIGIGIGGAENLPGAEAGNYKKVFDKAVDNGLKVVAHAGEVTGPELIWETLKELNVSRIGHGISAIYDEKLMDYLKERQIPLEICPTSNIFTQKYVKELSKHPIREFYDRGLFVTVNCDDPSVFGVELNDEYLNLYKYCNFTIPEIIVLIKNNLYATFLPKEEKDRRWKNVIQEIKRLKIKYNIMT